MRGQKNTSSIIPLIFCFLTGAALLTVCSRSSFLYWCNDWNDANSYFTMGKGLMNGMVIYRDLYDQKGPYLYFLYGLSYLISHDSFFGVFLFEIAAVTVFLYFGYRSIRLFCDEKVSLLLIPVLGAAVLSSKSFYWGGAAEEFCLPALSYSLYASLRYFDKEYPKELNARALFVNGLLAGIVGLVKYTMLGFYFAWIALPLLLRLFKKGGFRECLKEAGAFLGGMLTAFLPWLCYLGLNGALKDFYTCYIYNNIFYYSDLPEGAEKAGLVQKLYELLKLLYWLLRDNLSYFVLIAAGMAGFWLSFRTKFVQKLNLTLLFALLFFGIYFGGSNLPYYSIPLMVFAIPGCIVLGKLLSRFKLHALSKGVTAFFCIVVLVLSVLFAFTFSMNPKYRKAVTTEHFLYKFKELTDREEEPTLLMLTALDAGLYTVGDILPTCRYFQTNGIGVPELFAEQERYVAERRTQFVLTCEYYPEELLQGYELVDEEDFVRDEGVYTFYLFRRRDGAG